MEYNFNNNPNRKSRKSLGSVSFIEPGLRKSLRATLAADFRREHSFGIFERRLEFPIGFYRERDKNYYLRKQYERDVDTFDEIKEMWNARMKYQIRRRFKWPPNTLWGKIIWSFGYYPDYWIKRHAKKLIGENGQYVAVDTTEEKKEDSSGYDYSENLPGNLDIDLNDLDWERIEARYKSWKADQTGRKQTGIGQPKGRKSRGSLDAATYAAENIFRDELDNVDFDALEAELLRRKSIVGGFDSSDGGRGRSTSGPSGSNNPGRSSGGPSGSNNPGRSTGGPSGSNNPSRSTGDDKSKLGRRKSMYQPQDPTVGDNVNDNSDSSSAGETTTVTTVEYIIVKDPLKKKKQYRKSGHPNIAPGGPNNTEPNNQGQKSVQLPGLTTEESDKLWAAYNSGIESQDKPLVSKTTTEKRKSVKPLTKEQKQKRMSSAK